MISPVQLPSFASIKPPSSLMIHQHLLHQHTTLIHFEAVTLVTPKQKVEKSQKLKQNLKSFFLQKTSRSAFDCPRVKSQIDSFEFSTRVCSDGKNTNDHLFVHILVTVILRVIHTV